MKYITLSQDRQTIVDDEDYEELSKYKWHTANGYVVRHVSSKPDIREYMHRAVNKTPVGLVTDHINGDKLDNRRSNLRAATVSQNGANTLKRRSYGNFSKGVSLHRKTGLWRARLQVKGKPVMCKYFKTPEEARVAYQQAAKKLFGEFARLDEGVDKS